MMEYCVLNFSRNNMEIAVVYFREGYSPEHYPSQKVTMSETRWNKLLFNICTCNYVRKQLLLPFKTKTRELPLNILNFSETSKLYQLLFNIDNSIWYSPSCFWV